MPMTPEGKQRLGAVLFAAFATVVITVGTVVMNLIAGR